MYKGSPSSNCFERSLRMQNKHLKHARSRRPQANSLKENKASCSIWAQGSDSRPPSAPAWFRGHSQGKRARLALPPAVCSLSSCGAANTLRESRGVSTGEGVGYRTAVRLPLGRATPLLGPDARHDASCRGSVWRSLRPCQS